MDCLGYGRSLASAPASCTCFAQQNGLAYGLCKRPRSRNQADNNPKEDLRISGPFPVVHFAFALSPSLSRRWRTEPAPRSCKFNSVASEASRISPDDLRPPAVRALRIRVEKWIFQRGYRPGVLGRDRASVQRRFRAPIRAFLNRSLFSLKAFCA